MIIRLANKDDCSGVAKIHAQEIKLGFLSELGEKFLFYFYSAMIDSPNAFLIVAEDNGSIIGFISGCIDLKKFYRGFVRKYIIKITPILFKKVFNINSLKKILETTKYAKQEEKKLPETELVSFAVSSQFQGRGVAKKLLDEFFSKMRKNGVEHIRVIVGEGLKSAIKFYEKNGFKFYSKSFVHQDMPSRIYICKL